MLETSIPEHADVAAPPSLGPRDGWAGARTSSSALHTALHLAPPGSRACPGPRCASLVQNSKLVKALQDSGLAAETGSDRVGVFGLENVRVYAPPPHPLSPAPPQSLVSLLCRPHLSHAVGCSMGTPATATQCCRPSTSASRSESTSRGIGQRGSRRARRCVASALRHAAVPPPMLL